MSRSDLTILGYYGAGNFGDDLMLKGLVDEIVSRRPDIPVNIVSYYNLSPREITHRNVRVVRARSYLGKILRLAPIFLKSRIACFGGGTMFTDSDGDGAYKFFRLAGLLGCEYSYIGAGVGRLTKTNRIERARWLLQRCSFAVFRDQESLLRADKLVAPVKGKDFLLAEDLCYLYLKWNQSDQFETDSSNNRAVLLISWRNLSSEMSAGASESLVDAFVENVKTLVRARSFGSIQLLPLDKNTDIKVHEELMGRLRKELGGLPVDLVVWKTPAEALQVIRKAGLYVSVRLHGAFVGKIFAVPTVGLSYSPKIDYFFTSIDSKSVLGWNEIRAAGDSLKAVAYTAEQEAKNTVSLKHRISDAERNVDKLLSVFND